MAEFHMLHLSDLHIKASGLSGTHLKLIDDIKTQTQRLDRLFLVITGDIVHQGEYGNNFIDNIDNSEFINFFERLKDVLLEKVVDIQIVPGNHDKNIRQDEMRLYCPEQDKYLINDENQDKYFNEIPNKSYNEYFHLVNKIFRIFQIRTNGKYKKIIKAYGVELFKYFDTNICFIRLDTAWGSYAGGAKEQHNLVVYKQQLAELKKAYRTQKMKLDRSGEDYITFCISHHPISFLKPCEEDIIKIELNDEDRLNVDYLLCGHTHERSVSQLSNRNHTMSTLITGIGWDHNDNDDPFISQEQREKHCYSIYHFDEARNTQSTILRKTDVDGKFITDVSFHGGKVLSPLKTSSYPFILLNRDIPDEEKNLFVDECVIENLHKLSESLTKFEVQCTRSFENYKKSTDAEYNFTIFSAYLSEIVTSFMHCFQKYFEANSEKRAVFRIYDETKGSYIVHNFQARPETNSQGERITARTFQWNPLTEKAYRHHSTMIYSLNESDVEFSNIHWDNFLLIAPSTYEKPVYTNSIRETRPRFTFVFSIKYTDELIKPKEIKERKKMLAYKLYLMQYIGLSQSFERLLGYFEANITMDIEKYFTWFISNVSEGRAPPAM